MLQKVQELGLCLPHSLTLTNLVKKPFDFQQDWQLFAWGFSLAP